MGFYFSFLYEFLLHFLNMKLLSVEMAWFFGVWGETRFPFEIYWPLQLQHSSSWSTLSLRLVISLVLFAIVSIPQRTSDFLGRPNALFILWSNFGTLRSWVDTIRTANRTEKNYIISIIRSVRNISQLPRYVATV